MKYGHIILVLFLVALPTIVMAEAPVPPPICPHPVPSVAPRLSHIDQLKANAGSPSTADSELLNKKLAELDRLQKEVDELRKSTNTPAQILVKVQVLEINQTKLEKLDIDCACFEYGKTETAKVADSGAPCRDVKTVAAFLNSPRAVKQCNVELETCADKTAFAGLADTMIKNNVAKVLAEPTIVVLSGRPASFNVGGEVPVPAAGNEEVQFINYGTQIDLTAESLGNNKVRLHVRPRISELDTAHAATVDGNQIPGITVRQCNFCSETEFGKSIIVSGLVEQRTESCRTDAGVESRVQEINLAVIVTPEAVDPISPEAEVPHLSKRGDLIVEPASAKTYDAPAKPKSPESRTPERQ
jgi:pilus assembly protein CpaC